MREEIYELRELRHPNLIHFVGICYVMDGIGLITGKFFLKKKKKKIKKKNKKFFKKKKKKKEKRKEKKNFFYINIQITIIMLIII